MLEISPQQWISLGIVVVAYVGWMFRGQLLSGWAAITSRFTRSKAVVEHAWNERPADMWTQVVDLYGPLTDAEFREVIEAHPCPNVISAQYHVIECLTKRDKEVKQEDRDEDR